MLGVQITLVAQRCDGDVTLQRFVFTFVSLIMLSEGNHNGEIWERIIRLRDACALMAVLLTHRNTKRGSVTRGRSFAVRDSPSKENYLV